MFAVIRLRNGPERKARASRFYGSHTGGAWLVLFMIFTASGDAAPLPRRVRSALGTSRYDARGVRLVGVGHLLRRPATGRELEVWRASGCCCNIGVMLAFLVIVGLQQAPAHLRSRRSTSRPSGCPKALGPLLPMESDGKPIDFEDPGEDDVFGRGKIEDFTWKGMLDFATCTECGRCQSQCPAWNTGKPLSPKLVIMDLRDHLFAKAPYIIGGKDDARGGRRSTSRRARRRATTGHGVPESGFGRVTGSGPEQAARPLVGTAGAGRRDRPRRAVVVHHAAARASSSARSTSSTSTTSSTCAATRC